MVALWTQKPIQISALVHPDTGDIGNLVTIDGEELPENPEPPPEIEPPQVGCDPRVRRGEFTLDGYDLPEMREPIVELEEFGAQVGTDSTEALSRAINANRDGCTIKLRRGFYGLYGNTQFRGLRNVTIVGSGHGSGFYAVDQPFIGGWRALIEFLDCESLWIDAVEFDMRNQRIGCLRYDKTTDVLFSRLYCHDIGGGSSGGQRQAPLAAIKGSGWSKRHREIGNYLRGRGGGNTESGSRGTWGPQQGDGFDDALWEHCWVEDFGHTQMVPSAGDRGAHVVRHCTSIGSGGAACKSETPDSLRAREGQQQADVWWPTEPKVIIERCDFRHCAYHGVQAEEPTRIESSYIEGCTNGIASFNRLLTVEAVNNVLVNNRHAGIWCSLDAGQRFGGLLFERNTISGRPDVAAIGFDPKCKHPERTITIVKNKSDPGVTAVRPTPELAGYSGYLEEDNGPGAPGSDLTKEE